MVHFIRSDSCGLFHSAVQVTESLPPGYPIRTSADHRIRAPSRGFSQLIASFFALQLQGIRRGPIFRLAISSFLHVLFSSCMDSRYKTFFPSLLLSNIFLRFNVLPKPSHLFLGE